jgi:hypothetical protein
MINCLIFSKDRAMQLDAALGSFFLHSLDPQSTQVHVLYKASSARHARQYELLAADYPQVIFHPQKNFRRELFEILNPFQGNRSASRLYRILCLSGTRGFRVGTRPEILFGRIIDPPRLALVRSLFPSIRQPSGILFLVDDNIFIRDFSLSPALDALRQNPAALGFSLRLGLNTIYSYSINQFQSLPAFTKLEDGFLKYKWFGAEGDFNYPLEVSSSLYLTSTLLSFLAILHFRNPNELECAMASRTRVFRETYPELLCYRQSVTFCNPVNIVQSFHANRAAENFHYSVDDLLKRFERGERVDVGTYSGFIPNACHQEKELIFKKRAKAL